MTTGTVKLHRVLRATPERIYRAFLEPDAIAKWLPPYGFTCQVHHMDPKVGGTFKMSFCNFGTGHSHSFGGEYLELSPHEKISDTDRTEEHTSELQSLMRTSYAVSCLNKTNDNYSLLQKRQQ